MRRKNGTVSVAASLLGLALLSGCAGNAFSDSGDPQSAIEEAAGLVLGITQSEELGELVVDGEGNTLYRYDEDTADPPASNCNGDCAEAWPPVLDSENITFEGDQSLLGTVTREDGTEQVTLDGWPLYTYAEDSPGDTNGEGVNDVWWAVAPDGSKAADQGGGAGGDQVQLTITGHDDLGEIVVDEQGNTLYRFDEDTADPPASNCNGDCAEAWPPVESADEIVFNGDESLLGTVTRDDGTEQVTLGGWPLYTYAEDSPGDTNGEGVNNVWWAVSPLGTKANEEGWTEGYCPTGFQIATDPVLGEILVDDQGFTLYRFEEDTADPPASNCNGDCAEAWPPVLDMAEFSFEGGDASLLGSVTRDAGLDQVTINGWPVYRYAEDTAPGQTNGHGVNGTWYAMTPTGEKAGEAADSGGGAGDGAGDGDAGGTDDSYYDGGEGYGY